MNKYEKNLQKRRIKVGRADYVFRIKDKMDKGKIKPVWKFKDKSIYG
jgi:hypothetical protein